MYYIVTYKVLIFNAIHKVLKIKYDIYIPSVRQDG